MQGSFSWEEGGEASLTDLDFRVPVGSLVAVVGTTGTSLAVQCSLLCARSHCLDAAVQCAALPCPGLLSCCGALLGCACR